MSSEPTPGPRESSGTEQEQVTQWLADADAAAKAEDWDKTIALYRKALEFDRYMQGVEAKLQWALRMRDIHKLYLDGKAKIEAGDYEGALVPLRKARVMYASHYKDVDELIVQAQTALQKEKWDERPTRKREKRNPLFFVGAAVIVLVGILMLVSLYLQGGGFGSTSNLPQLSDKIPQVTGSMKTTPSGLEIIEVQQGTGSDAVAGKTVSVNYTGYLTDGSVFDKSDGQPISFVLGSGQVIPGWEEGIAGMKAGGKRRLIIPPDLAYGDQGAGGVIPPKATLVFDVELTGVQ